MYKRSGCDSKTIPFDLDFDCSLLAPTSSGGFRGSILGPSRLEADEGDLLVSEIFFVVDDFGSFVDSDGLDSFVVFVVLVNICTGLPVIGKLVVHCVDDEGTLAVLFNLLEELKKMENVNPKLTNGYSHHLHGDEGFNFLL